MLQIRMMRRDDIPLAIRLSDEERWGVTRRDMARILRLDPKGSFVASMWGKKVGLVTTTSYGQKLGWIGNVVVNQEYRGKHIGQNLVQTAIEYLLKRHTKHVALYCFDNNVKFYQKLGFKRDAPFLRLLRRTKPSLPFRKAQPEFALSRLLSMDKRAFGVDRSRLIRNVIVTKAGWCTGISNNRSSGSALLIKNYQDMSEFGPWVSVNAPEAETREVLRLALSKTWRKPIEVSCLRSQGVALRLLTRNGFEVINHGHRMYFDRVAKIGEDSASYALGFLDKG
jgi:predicted N-acetyltransferase YhbS